MYNEKWIKCDIIEALDNLDVYIPIKVYFNIGDYYLNVVGFDKGDIGYKCRIYENWEEFVRDMESGIFHNATYYYRNGE